MTSNKRTSKAELVIQDIGIEEPVWTTNRILTCLVANVGTGIALVTKMWIEVLAAVPFNALKPVGPGAPIIYYEYEVALDPQTKEYLLNANEFAFSPGEYSGYKIRLLSEEAFIYTIRLHIEWRDMKETSSSLLSTESHRVSFPISSIEGALAYIQKEKRAISENQRLALTRQLAKLHGNLAEVQNRRAEFIDPRAIPPDLEIAERGIRDQIRDVEEQLSRLEGNSTAAEQGKGSAPGVPS